jgi:hypothetical protein
VEHLLDEAPLDQPEPLLDEAHLVQTEHPSVHQLLENQL